MIGSILEKYEVQQKIGEGGMATVYRARHTSLGRDVAIKVLHPHLSSSARNRERFAREARAIAHLDHDGVLKIFDYSGIDTDECYIVTELVDGPTLQSLISEHERLPSELLLLVAHQLVAALGYAHSLGIVHRDLKPENVMVRKDGAVKLMDFGIARFLDEVNLTMTGALVGSPAYMSPEQALEKPVDARSDLFSLGTLLFHAVTGQLPFSGSNPSLILRNIIEGRRPEVLELAPDANDGLAELIERLLQTDAGDRPASCEAALAEVEAALAAVEVDPADPTWSVQRWLLDPQGWAAQAQAHLRGVLLRRGKDRLSAGDHLGALRVFNRLLSIDEDNAEVLTLVQGMHTTGKGEGHGRSALPWLAAAAALLLGTTLAWAFWPDPPPAALINVGESPAAEVKPAPLPESPAPQPVVAPEPSPAPTPAAEPRPVKISPVYRQSPPRRPPPPGPDGLPVEPGRITVVVPGSWGRIYIDNTLIGRTGEVGVMKVTPGRHTLRVENDLSLPWDRPFDVAPGEQLDFSPPLVPKPATAQLPPTVAGDCLVALDGVGRGAVSALGGEVPIRDPRSPHVIELRCPDAPTLTARIEPVRPGSVFMLTLR